MGTASVYTRGQLAKLAGVNLETIPYYVHESLLPRTPRTASGYREFSEPCVPRLHFIRRAKDLGFSLREILELLQLSSYRKSERGEALERTRKKRAEVEAKIKHLRALKRTLDKLAEACSGHCQMEKWSHAWSELPSFFHPSV